MDTQYSRAFVRYALSFILLSCLATIGHSQVDAVRVQSLFDSGNDLLEKGEFQNAVDKYTEVIAITPQWPLPYINRGIANLSLSRLTEALSDADKSLNLLSSGSSARSHSALAYNLKGLIFLQRGDAQGSIEFFSESIRLEPTNALRWNGRGNAYQKLKRYDEALADYSKAIELNKTIAQFFTNRATINQHLKNYTAAASDLDDALRLDKNNSAAYYTRANINLTLGKLDEALPDYNQAISLKPRAEYYHGRGILYYKKSKWDLAVQDNTDAIKLDPKNAHAYANRGACYIRLGKLGLAVEDYRKVVDLIGASIQGRYGLAYLFYQTGQYSAALTEANQVISLASNWRSAYQLRSAIYSKLGNTVKAKADNDTAQKMTSENRPLEGPFAFDLSVFVPEEKQK